MSRLRIQHRTTYAYSRPVRFGSHRLVLHPREGHDLRVVSMSLTVSPAHRLIWTRDLFGNSVAFVERLDVADRLEILSDVIVQRSPPFPAQDLHQPWQVSYPFTYDPMEQAIAAAYQVPSYPDEQGRIQAWVGQHVQQALHADAEQMLLGLGAGIHRQIHYVRRTERGVQSPDQTLALGSGSCRDLATLMMEAARMLGIASRFVSGYLHCEASIAGRASTHAWMEAYLPGLGWRGFDPTLGEPTSLKHVPIGVSHHPRGVMPVSGTFDGTVKDFLHMEVQVQTDEVP